MSAKVVGRSSGAWAIHATGPSGGRRICPMRAAGGPAHDGAMPDPTDSLAAPTAELLITLGRDREAVEVATRDHGQITTPGGPMDGARQLDELIPLLEVLVAGISPDGLDATTLCTDFTVRGVLDHMIGGASAFAPAFRGQPAPAGGGSTDEGTIQERWRRAMADLLDAVHCPGADERTIAAPFGEVPGSVFARFVAFDGLVHGWDLATATGQAYAPPPAIVEEVSGFARQVLTPDLRDGDTFADESEAPAGASPLERLVAFSGRQLPGERTPG
jgi:uncharacterized protein (TIGR03086 family)